MEDLPAPAVDKQLGGICEFRVVVIGEKLGQDHCMSNQYSFEQ